MKGPIREREIRPEEQSEKKESCWENLWKETQLKGPIKTEIDTRTKGSGQARLVYVRHKYIVPTK